MSASSHKAVVRESFTRQADIYAVTPTVADPVRIERLLEAVSPARTLLCMRVPTRN
jgi:hypothetical protein